MASTSRSVASDGFAVCFICEKTDEKEPLSKLTSRGKPVIENLLAESSNNQFLAKFQGLWDNYTDSNIVYYPRNFFCERGNQHSEGDRGRKRDEGRVKLFKELFNWLEEGMEDNVYTGPVA